MKKLLLCFFLVLMGITSTIAKTYKVVFISTVGVDTALIDAMKNAGYKVQVGYDYWKSITDEKVAELNAFDLVVISRATNSSDFGDANIDGTLNVRWASVTTPIINMSNYIARTLRQQWFNTDAISDNGDSYMLAADTTHPIFNRITLSGNDSTLQLTEGNYGGIRGMTNAGNGRVIATIPALNADASLQNTASIAEWNAGTAFYSGTGAPVANAGKRMWFAGTHSPSYFKDEGKQLFLNAVEYMITGTVSETDDPINSNKVQAETYNASSGINAEATSDIDGDEDIIFTEKGHWAEYSLDIDVADYYEFKLRVASSQGNDTLRILEGGTIIGHAIINTTGGSQNWSTISIPVNLASTGIKTIRIEALSNIDTLKVNWFDYLDHGLGSSSLVFNAQGKPSEIMLDGMNVLGSTSIGGFTLFKFNGKDREPHSSFTSSTSGNILTLISTTEPVKFTFRIDTYPRHISMHLIDVDGIDDARNYGLQLKIRFNQRMGYKTLSDLIWRNSLYNSSSNELTLKWQYLYGVEGDGYRGGFVFWDGTLSGPYLDETLAEIWSTESQMPIPAEQPSWTSSDILNWIDNYAAKFNNMTQIQLQPTSITELYSMMENYVIPCGVKQVYLHCPIWRDEYWPRYNSRVHINTEMFPRGKADLKAYIDYLHDLDMTIALHNVSYGIGKHDPDYVVGKVDRRLGSWGTGTLESPINSSQTRILFRPDSSVVIPLLGDNSHSGRQLEFKYMRIGEEIVRVGAFSRTEKDVWILTGCTRGYEGTNSSSHGKGSDMAGLFCSYNQNYIPAFDMDKENSLARELAIEYADFVNEMELDHLHFDGPEIHEIKSPWCVRPMLSEAYRHTNRPTTTSRVGRNLAANFELEFSQIKYDQSYEYFPLEIGLRLHDRSDNMLATSLMSTHFHATEALMLGARRVNLIGVFHADGITQKAIDQHGLGLEVFQIFRYYKELTPVFDQADIDYLDIFLDRRSGSSHFESDDALILSKNSDGDYIYTPYHVLGYADGSTETWHISQELGAIPRSIVVKAGTEMKLTNPKGARDLNVIIRVSDAVKSIIDPRITLSTGGSIEFTGTLKPNEYLQYESGASEGTICNKDWKPIGTLTVSQSNFTAPAGAVSATVTGSSDATTSLEVQLYVKDDPYVLATNSKLK